jgi:phage terminase Nu1 subunit (DNA packaging protein)
MSTQKEVAEHLDISDRQVRNLLSKSILPVSKGAGGYDLDGCRIAYISYLRNMSRTGGAVVEASGGDIDIEAERAGLTKAQRISQELKNEILEGRYMAIETIQEILSKILIQVGGILAALPLNLKRKHPELEKRVIDSIQAEIIKHQNEAAKLDEFIEQAVYDSIEQARGS